jgi:Rv0078B-related antitoxin
MPNPPDDKLAAARLRKALELWEVGVEAKEKELRREDPTADDATINARLADWLGHNGFNHDEWGDHFVRRPRDARKYVIGGDATPMSDSNE